MATAGAQCSGLSRLMWAIDDSVDDKGPQRKEHFRNFLRDLHFGGIRVSEWELAVQRLPMGATFGRGDLLPGSAELYAALSDSEKARLKEHYFTKLRAIDPEFPDLRREFSEQFL